MNNQSVQRQLEFDNNQNKPQAAPVSPISKTSEFQFSKKHDTLASQISAPPPPPASFSSRHKPSIDKRVARPSRWNRFLSYFICCNNNESDVEAENASSTAKLSNCKSFKSNQAEWIAADHLSGSNSEAKLSSGSQIGLQFRNTSNSNPQLYNILSFCQSGYSQLCFGHYSFLQIPVRFEQYQYTTRKQFSDIFSRIFSGEHALVVQAYLDWDFVGSISKGYEFVLCAFSSYLTSLPPPNAIAANYAVNGVIQYNQNMQGSSGQATTKLNNSSSSSGQGLYQYTKIPDDLYQKHDLHNTEFLYCQDLNYTMNLELFDKILVIPASLKQQGNSFDGNFNMRQEFRHSFQEALMNHIEILNKTLFVVPKYCKIRELMLIIYDCFYKSNLTIYELNFGIQFHSFSDEFFEVECIVIQFSENQHLETVAALSQRVFSNINPTIPTLCLSPKKKLDESNKQLEKSKQKRLEESQKSNKIEVRQQQLVDTNSEKQSNKDSVKSDTAKRSQDEFIAEEDSHAGKVINANQKPISEFFEDEYVSQIGQACFKNLYNFLKELNTQFIIQDNIFYYRTHVIDVMLKNNIIQQQFIQTLVNHFLKQDLIKHANAVISPKNGSQKGEKSQGQKKNKKNENNKKGNQQSNNLDFKEFFRKNSQYFKLNLDDTIEKNDSNLGQMYSPSDYEDQSQTTTDQDNLHFGEKNSQTSQPMLTQQNHNTPPVVKQQQQQLSSQPIEEIPSDTSNSNRESHQNINNQSADQPRIATRIRPKQTSLNYYTSGTRNKHIGFKSNKQAQGSFDEDILNRTTASKIFGDKKILKDLELLQEVDTKSNSKQINIKFIQEVIPEEIYSNTSSKMLRNRNFSQK
ncbi:hypothetical protein TTHERM_00853030 (macronuclear) [Tetrahymena thermophila SB210]|uniref:Uncharacterized protein n=1 Tax=Tetrahymena thermophila (strain SB210) TaxID=312017 RepID=Q24E37_TETTS|nr:hypothetical protein TTHERM_00853030 [Tetrahymena thermophila SB210]EAS06064.1 hypothetical protein TTHERM_00853030 [Tetrahymena thermophila SB210]|eukprot:XP_001026309.1 hypothetical protein TTHERM_00853030 [Tetrahymena thermophila SB210]